MELGCQKAWSVLLTIAWSKRRKSLSSFEILLAVPHFWFVTVFRHMYSNYCTAKMSLSSWLDPLCIWDVGGVSTAVFASEARWSKLPNWKLYRDHISSSCGHLWGEAESSGIASDLLRALESTSMSTWSYMILYVYMYMVNICKHGSIVHPTSVLVDYWSRLLLNFNAHLLQKAKFDCWGLFAPGSLSQQSKHWIQPSLRTSIYHTILQ